VFRECLPRISSARHSSMRNLCGRSFRVVRRRRIRCKFSVNGTLDDDGGGTVIRNINAERSVSTRLMWVMGEENLHHIPAPVPRVLYNLVLVLRLR